MMQTVNRSTILPRTTAGEASMPWSLRAVLVSDKWSYAGGSWQTGKAATSLGRCPPYMPKVTVQQHDKKASFNIQTDARGQGLSQKAFAILGAVTVHALCK